MWRRTVRLYHSVTIREFSVQFCKHQPTGWKTFSYPVEQVDLGIWRALKKAAVGGGSWIENGLIPDAVVLAMPPLWQQESKGPPLPGMLRDLVAS